MKRRLATLLLLALLPAACAAPVVQGHRSDALDASNALARGDYRLSANVVVNESIGSDFRLGEEKDEWDEGSRFELDFLFHFPAEEYIEPIGGGYLFYEDHEYDDGLKHIDYDVYGFGIEFGALFTPMKEPDKAPIVFGVMPYTRIGCGYQDGVFRNIPSDDGTSSGGINDWRMSIGLGIDARANFFQRILAGVGVGFEYWSSGRPDGTTRDPSGVVVEEDDRLRFRGTDWWLRASIGFKF